MMPKQASIIYVRLDETYDLSLIYLGHKTHIPP